MGRKEYEAYRRDEIAIHFSDGGLDRRESSSISSRGDVSRFLFAREGCRAKVKNITVCSRPVCYSTGHDLLTHDRLCFRDENSV